MIIADANLIAYVAVVGDHSEGARRVAAADADWLAPTLWRSEVRSVLLKHIRSGRLNLADCAESWARAETIVRDAPRRPDTGRVLEIAMTRRLSAYDAEYVATAVELSVPLVTADRRLLERCPREAVSIEAFARGVR